MRARNRLLLALASAGLAIALVVSCAGQAEGDRCQLANGNDDCQAGLVCTQGAKLNRNYDLCCPPEGTTVTSDSCKVAPISPGSDAAISDAATTDTGVKDTGTSDACDAATSDASDAASDSGDASADATAE